MNTSPNESWALLIDGELVCLRQLTSDDLEQTERLHSQMSADNQYLRFFGYSKAAPHRLAVRLCSEPDDGRYALGCLQAGELIGVAHYDRDPDDTRLAEVAMAVADRAHHKGIGTLMLEHVASHARMNGIESFTAEVLSWNTPMLHVFADAGLRIVEHRDGEVMSVVASLDGNEAYLDAVAGRERTAQSASLQHVLRPASIAVIGASERRGNVGGMVVRNLVAARYAGKLAVVHPSAQPVCGVESKKSLADLGFEPELVVVVRRPEALTRTMADCGHAGARAALVLSSGVDAETGRDVRDMCRSFGMRLVGPNCLGVESPAHKVAATFAAHPSLKGDIGLAVQSGGVGIALAERLAGLGFGISSFVSLGDKYDVSATDLLQFWAADPETRMAVLYVESFGNPRKFAGAARRLAQRIPLLAVDGGRSAPAQQAAVSHTAAAATPTAAREALFADAGIIATTDIGDLIATMALFGTQPMPAGRRVAILSNAGGAGILAADACAEAGLSLPALAEKTRLELAEVLPTGASIANPVDASAACGHEAFSAAIAVLAADPGIDAVLALPLPTGVDDLRALSWPVRTTTVVGVRLDHADQVVLEEGVPVYASTRDAATAISRGARRSEWLRKAPATAPDPVALEGLRLADARAIVAEYLEAHPDGGWLDPSDAARLVTTMGIEPVEVRQVSSAEEAAEAAVEIGLPVAIKAYGPTLLHKQHAGGLVLDIRDRLTVMSAYLALAGTHREAMVGAVVQPMVHGDVELLVGVNSDSVFGPVVAFGLGGTEADALADRVVRLAPLDGPAASNMLRDIRAVRILEVGASGHPVDTAALEDLLVRVSVLADRVPELADMDLNPVLACREGLLLPDVKVRIRPRSSYDPFLRRLR